jgi:hypothetical protein
MTACCSITRVREAPFHVSHLLHFLLDTIIPQRIQTHHTTRGQNSVTRSLHCHPFSLLPTFVLGTAPESRLSFRSAVVLHKIFPAIVQTTVRKLRTLLELPLVRHPVMSCPGPVYGFRFSSISPQPVTCPGVKCACLSNHDVVWLVNFSVK